MIRLAGFALMLAAVLAAAPAPAQQAAPAAPPANPAFDAAKAAADGLGPDAVAAIQRGLIWTGDLNTLASGEFGRRSFDAIRAFQRRLKAADDGILTAPQRLALDKAAKAAAGFGMKPVTSGGVSLAYPAKLATGRTEGRFGPKFSAPDGSVTVDILRYPVATETADALFERLRTERPGRAIAYSLSRPDALVIAGTSDGKSFYMRFLKLPDATAGFVLGWDPKLSPAIDRLAIAMAVALAPEGAEPAMPSAAAPVPSPAAAPAGPVGRVAIAPVPGEAGARRDGSGVLVGERDLIVPAGLVAGCASVTLAGGGEAPVVAGDAAAGVALIRLAEPRRAGLALRDAPLTAGEPLRLVGAAGIPAPVEVAALSGPGEDTRRVRLEGAGGPGALIDAGGRLAGFAGLADGSALKPRFLAAFLRAQGVAAASPGGGDPVRVGLSCVPPG